MCALYDEPDRLEFSAVPRQENAYPVINELAPAKRQDLVAIPLIESADSHALAVKTAKQMSGSPLQCPVRAFVAKIDVNPTRDLLVSALDDFDSRQFGNSICKRYACLEVFGSVTLVADASWQSEASRHSVWFSRGSVAKQERLFSRKYLANLFDVKYFYIKIK